VFFPLLNFIYIVEAQMQTVGNKTVISGLRSAMVYACDRCGLLRSVVSAVEVCTVMGTAGIPR